MDDEIETAPLLLHRAEHRVNGGRVRHIAMAGDKRAQLFGERAHALFQRLALIGKSQLRPGLMRGARDAPGNGAIVGKAHDKPALAAENTH